MFSIQFYGHDVGKYCLDNPKTNAKDNEEKDIEKVAILTVEKEDEVPIDLNMIDTGQIDYEKLGARPKQLTKTRRSCHNMRSFGQIHSEAVAERDAVVANDIGDVIGNLPGRLDIKMPPLETMNLETKNCSMDSPIRANIARGSVASKRDMFDRLSKKGDDVEPNLKRLKKSGPQQSPTSSGPKKKKRGKKSFNQSNLPSNQTLILEYLRGGEGVEKGS